MVVSLSCGIKKASFLLSPATCQCTHIFASKYILYHPMKLLLYWLYCRSDPVLLEQYSCYSLVLFLYHGHTIFLPCYNHTSWCWYASYVVGTPWSHYYYIHIPVWLQFCPNQMMGWDHVSTMSCLQINRILYCRDNYIKLHSWPFVVATFLYRE